MMDDDDETQYNLSDPVAVEQVLTHRKKKQEDEKKKVEEERKEREKHWKYVKSQRNKQRFFAGCWAILLYLYSRFVVVRNFVFGAYWFEPVPDNEQYSRWQFILVTFVFAHGKKITLVVSFLSVLIFLWILWKAGVILGLWGVVPLSSVYYEGSVQIRNAWISDWADEEQFAYARSARMPVLTAEHMEQRFIEMNIMKERYNVSFGRLAESMREKLSETSCIAAVHLGVPLRVYQIGQRWVAQPEVTKVSEKTWTAEVSERFGTKRSILAPYGAKITYLTQTGGNSRAELGPMECACLAALTSLHDESLFPTIEKKK